MNLVTGFLISPRRPPLQDLTVGPAPSPILPLFSVFWFDRPRNAKAAFIRQHSLPWSILPPGHNLPSSLRFPRLLLLDRPHGGVGPGAFLWKREGRGRRGLTPRHRRQAAPLVSAVHGCYEHSADDELFLLSLILSASLYSRITCIFSPPL